MPFDVSAAAATEHDEDNFQSISTNVEIRTASVIQDPALLHANVNAMLKMSVYPRCHTQHVMIFSFISCTKCYSTDSWLSHQVDYHMIWIFHCASLLVWHREIVGNAIKIKQKLSVCLPLQKNDLTLLFSTCACKALFVIPLLVVNVNKLL